MPTVNDSATRAKYDWPSPEVFAARLLLHDHLFIASPTDDELVPAPVPPQPVPVPRRQRKRSLATVLAAAQSWCQSRHRRWCCDRTLASCGRA